MVIFILLEREDYLFDFLFPDDFNDIILCSKPGYFTGERTAFRTVQADISRDKIACRHLFILYLVDETGSFAVTADDQCPEPSYPPVNPARYQTMLSRTAETR